MRNLKILILCSLLYQMSYTQNDPWWIIPNNSGIGANGDIAIKDLQQPAVSTGSFSESPENLFFVIYPDGCHIDYNQATNDQLSISSSLNNGYNLKVGPEYKLIYLASIYGDDVPPTDISSNTFSNFVTRDITPKQSYNEPILLSRKPTPGFDFTIIINHKYLNDACKYELCITPQNTEQIQFINPSSIIDNAYYAFNLVDVSNKQSCYNYVYSNSLTEDSPYGYVNFNMSGNTPKDFYNSALNISLTGKEPCTFSANLQEKTGDPDDPNFVKVRCIGEKDNYKYVQYEIQCFNKKLGTSVDSLRFEIEFPETVKSTPEDITVTSAKIGDNISLNPNKVFITSEGNKTVFRFDKDPNHIPEGAPAPLSNGKNVGNIHLCMQIKADYDIASVDLHPPKAISYFNETPFIIHDFIDPCNVSVKKEDKRTTIINSDKFEVKNGVLQNCIRSNDLTCNCPTPQETETPKLFWMIAALAIFIIIIGFYWKHLKKKLESGKEP